MLFNEIHTIRDQNQMVQWAQLTGVTKEFDERPDYVCIQENADGTCVCSEWLRDDEFTFTPNNQVGSIGVSLGLHLFNHRYKYFEFY